MAEPAPEPEKLPWYFGKGSLVIAFLCVGPLMLPLLWLHPRISSTRKILWTVAIAVLSYFLVVATLGSIKNIEEYYRQMRTMMSQ